MEIDVAGVGDNPIICVGDCRTRAFKRLRENVSVEKQKAGHANAGIVSAARGYEGLQIERR